MNKKIIGIAIVIIIAIIGVILIMGSSFDAATYKNITLGDCAIEVTNDTYFDNDTSESAYDSYTIHYNVTNTDYDDYNDTSHDFTLNIAHGDSSYTVVSSVSEYMDNCKQTGDNITKIGSLGNWTILEHQYEVTLYSSEGSDYDLGFSATEYEIVQIIDGKFYMFSCNVDDLDLLKDVVSTFHQV